MDIKGEKKKQPNIPHEHKCGHSQENTNKLNLAVKGNIPQPGWDCPRNIRVIRVSNINESM